MRILKEIALVPVAAAENLDEGNEHSRIPSVSILAIAILWEQIFCYKNLNF
jgi:hypothetical protein